MEETSSQSVAAIVDSIFGTPAYTATSTLEGAKKDMLDSVLNAIGESQKTDEKFLKDNYSHLQDHIETIRSEFEEILEDYFPGRWDIQNIEVPDNNTLEKFRKFVNGLEVNNPSNRQEFIDKLTKSRLYDSYHNYDKKLILIHFPEITIKNREGKNHLIKGLWMKFHYNFIFRMLRMGGIRSLKTFGEYMSNYNHSHMNCTQACSANHWLGCCLGNTDYSTLTIHLYSTFDKIQSTLFFQQLEDYLSWESIDGGPYMRMEDIGNRNYNTRSVYMNSNDLTEAYKQFIIKYPSGYNIELSDNGIYYHFKVLKDEEFKAKVCDVCPEQFRMLYDTIHKRQYVDNSRSGNSLEIRSLNDGYRRQKLFDFKGQPVYFQIEDPNTEADRSLDPSIIKMAPEGLINHIAANLEQNINAYYANKFVKERIFK